MQIYIHKNGQTLGPFNIEEIKQGLQANQYTLADMAHTQGIEGWKSLHDVLSFLRNQARGGPPAIPPSNAAPSGVADRANQALQNVQTNVNSVSDGASRWLSSPAIRAFLNEEQDPAAVARVYDRLMQICMPDEQVLYIAVQKKLVLTIAPTSVALTNKRVIIFRAHSLGLALTFEDHYWINVINIHVNEGVLGAIFSVRLNDNRQPFVDSLPKAQGRRLYQFGQQMEEQMHRYRRELVLEERRAGAGNMNVNVGMNSMMQPQMNGVPPQYQMPPQQQQQPEATSQHMLAQAQPEPGLQPSAEDPVEKLGKLKAMLDRGLISQAEYDAKKTEIMARL